jgi:hypothetical protein
MTIVDVFERGAKSLMRLLPLYLNLAFQGPYRWASEMWIVDLLNKKQKVRGGCCPCTFNRALFRDLADGPATVEFFECREKRSWRLLPFY